MTGSDSIYRLRVGDYRILYELSLVDYTLTLVDIIDADNRGQIYKYFFRYAKAWRILLY